MGRIILIYSFLGMMSIVLIGQPTVGTLTLDESIVAEGYTLIYPNKQSSVFLIDNCGEVINQWDLHEWSRPGSKSLLDSLGNLYVCSSNGELLAEPSFGSGGAGGLIEIYNWDNDLIWQYKLADSLYRQHHDIDLLPNGNIILIAWKKHNLHEIVSMGFDTVNNPQTQIWSDAILEINPSNDSIVWEWDAWDHLIQDYDGSKMNYGVVSENPGRIDVNYHKFSAGRQDWLHCNSIDYNRDLDQIVISSRNFNEFWIVDHSTTTIEAASSTGGNSGLGGDLLYRWGNPEAYKSGNESNRQCFFQHDVGWSDLDSTNSKMYFYNNWVGKNLSLGNTIKLEFDMQTQRYAYDSTMNQFLPIAISDTFSHPDTLKNFSTAASSIQLLPNDNILMCSGRQGRVFELTQQGELAWEYLIPMRNGFPIDQGDMLSLSDNFTFQAKKYNYDFFNSIEHLDLGYIESNFEKSFCLLSDIEEFSDNSKILNVFPNPSYHEVVIDGLTLGNEIVVIDILGNSLANYQVNNLPYLLQLDFSAGLYYVLEVETGLISQILIKTP